MELRAALEVVASQVEVHCCCYAEVSGTSSLLYGAGALARKQVGPCLGGKSDRDG